MPPTSQNTLNGITWIYGSSMELGVTPNFMEFHGTLVPPNKTPPSSMGFEGTYLSTTCFLDFHGILHVIPWNSWVTKPHVTKFHGILWNLMSANLNDIRLLWASMVFCKEVHRAQLWCRQIKYHQVPRNSMEPGDCSS